MCNPDSCPDWVGMCSSQYISVLPKKLLDVFQEEHPQDVIARQLLCAAQAQSSLGRIRETSKVSDGQPRQLS